MSSVSPSTVLFSSDGYESAVVSGSAIPAGTRGYLDAGSDGTNARFMSVDASGNQVVVGAGTSGSPSGGVITIQGIGGGTAVPVSGTVTATNPSVGSNNATSPSSSTQIGGSDGTNLQASRVFDLDTGGGAEYNIGISIRLPSSGGSVAGGTASDPIRVDPTGTTTQPISGTVTANAGTGNFTVVQGTASNLNATVIGTTNAGSGASTGLITVQGNASGTPIPVITNKASTSSITSVVGATSNTVVLTANANRVQAAISNGTTKNMYVKLGTIASTSSYTIILMRGAYWEVPQTWVGEIDAVWDTAVSGSALITELTS